MALLQIEKQQEIDKAIEQIQLDTGLSYPENGLISIASALNVDVSLADLSDFQNKKQSETSVLFTLAHELGHFILHKNSNKLRIDLFDYSQATEESTQETEANYFAG